MFKELRNNQCGTVLVMVLMALLGISIVAVSIMSVSVSQVTTGKDTKQSIQAKELALGVFYQYATKQIQGAGTIVNGVAETMDGRNFSISVANQGPIGPNTTNQIDVVINY